MAELVRIRPVQVADLDSFFLQQQEPIASQMAAFTAKDPTNRSAFDEHWAKIRADSGILLRTIIWDGKVIGNISSHSWFGELELSYWLGRAFWGQGLATQALKLFLNEQTERPIFARIVADNVASGRVLAKCGFVIVGHDEGFANARQEVVDETIYKLS